MDNNNTKDRIIESIIELINKYPYNDISTYMIIKQAGIGKGTLYWHFKNKNDIFITAFKQCYDELISISRRNLDLCPTVFDKLCTRLSNIVEFGLAYPDKTRVISQYIVYQNNSNSNPFPYGEFAADIKKIVNEGLEKGEFIKLPEDYLISYIFSSNNYLTNYIQEHPEYYSDKDTFNKILKSIFLGIKNFQD